MATTRRYLLLPGGQLRASSNEVMASMVMLTPGALSKNVFASAPKSAPAFKVLESLHETGVKLVESQVQDPEKLAASMPGVVVVPEVFYHQALAPRHSVARALPSAMGLALAAQSMTLTVTGTDGTPIDDATVVAFTSFAQRQGAQGTTDATGKVRLQLPSQFNTLERVYVYVEGKYWSMLLNNVQIRSQVSVTVPVIDLNTPDILASLYAMTTPQMGAGVKVGVIDSGVSLDHPDLTVTGGLNCVQGDGAPDDFGSLGGGHGTHVGGIIAGHGVRPTGMRGLAPAAELRSYRVFRSTGGGASNFDIIKAIEQAVADGCHIINMSLGGGDPDLGTERAISFAWNGGCVSVVANGNDERSPVSFPARFSLCCAVSAFGRQGTCPPETVSSQSVAPPADPTGKFMVADFSNVGPETDFTGPGVGVVSTWPGRMYAALDGTSMACPAVAGRTAALLSENTAVLGMPADASRSAAIRHMMEQTAVRLGFGVDFEGFGYLP